MYYDYDWSGISDVLDYYMFRALRVLTEENFVNLIILGVILAFSDWDKQSGLFVVISAYGVARYSYASLDEYRRELTEKKLPEIRRKQYALALDIRLPERLRFIPVKEQRDDPDLYSAAYYNIILQKG